MVLIRDVKGAISVFQELKKNGVKSEDTRLWEHVQEQDPKIGLLLQGEPS